MASITRLNQHVATVLVSTSGIAMGVTLGWNSLATSALRTSIGFDPEDIDIIGSVVALGASLGAILVPILITVLNYILPKSYRISTNGLMAITALPCLAIGWIIVWIADYSYKQLVLGRLITGIGMGLISVLTPLYIAEMTIITHRDTLMFYFHLMITFGIACSYGLGYNIYPNDDSLVPLSKYGLACGICCLPVLLCCATPVSPLQLTVRGNEDAASEMLRRIKSTSNSVQVSNQEIEEVHMLAKACDEPWSRDMIKNWKVWKSMLIATLIMISSQLSGAYPMTFNTYYFIDLNPCRLTTDEIINICAIVQVTVSIAAIPLVIYLGRRILLIISSLLMAMVLIALGLFLILNTSHGLIISHIWVAPTCFILSLAFYNMGFGPISWTLLADSFPIQLRVYAASIVATVGWLTCFIINYKLDTISDYLRFPILLFVFAGVCCFTSLVSWFGIKDERGRKSLADIQEEFRIS